MTANQLKRIAEACGYEVRDNLVRDDRGCLGSVLPPETDNWGEVPDEIERFRPHLDANQAIECLARRFGDPSLQGFTISFSPWLREPWGVETENGSGEARTFPLAAMNAILESLK